MKNLIKYGFYTFLAVLMASCTKRKSTSINEISNNRIKLKEVRIINTRGYYILEVDGKEYLASDNGGFVAITK